MQRKYVSTLVIGILLLLLLTTVVSADENKVNVMYISWTPSPALEAASQSMAYSSDVVYTYVPSFNTTTWTGPSDELLAAASSGLLMEQDVIFTDMLSNAVFDPMNPSFKAAKDNGTSFVDIRSLRTPEYFDYVSDGSSMEPIDTYYNNMGIGTPTETQNAEDLLTYLCKNYGNKPQITDNWGGKIHIVYIGWQPSAALADAANTTRFNDSIEFTYIPSFNTTTWAGPSDELMQAASSGLLLQQDVIFTDMLSSAVFEPLSETFQAAAAANISLVDIRSMGTPEYFDYISDGSSTQLIDTYYNNMGTATEEERLNAENLVLYLAKEYGNRPEITDKWDTIKIMYLCYAANPALENASLTNPYSQNIEYTYIPSFNVTNWADPSDELLQVASSGLLLEQDVIFCDMLSSSIYGPLNQSFWEAHAAGTVFVDVRSIDTPAYFDHVYTGDENVTLLNYYNNMGTQTDAQLTSAENFLIYLAKEYGGNPELTADWQLQGSDTSVLPQVGLYHKDHSGKYFETTQQYLEWYSTIDGTHHVYDPSKPTIGMWFHRDDIANGQMGVVDALISDLEDKDCNVIVGFDTFDDIVKYYCDDNNQSLVQCVISLKSFRLNYYDNEKGERELSQLDVPVLRGIVVDVPQTPDPADANRGIPNAQVVRMTLGPNLDGIFEYVVIGKNVYDSTNGTSEAIPIDSQVDWIGNRSINWANLKSMDNSEKKVAVIYYNYPSGKDNIGASYLDTISSMRLMLQEMQDAGFNVTSVPVNNTELLDMIQAQGINAGCWAPGVLNEMVGNRTSWGLQLIPMGTYREWFEAEIPQDLRDDVIEEWGAPWQEDLPEDKNLMIWENNSGKYLVIPTVQFGNVWLMPQPARGFMQSDDTLYHSTLVPPPHQYIAFYLWLNNQWDADAVIHLGTHGTHEWLPGQAYGMNRTAEWSPLLLQDMPNIYPYIVANVGEGLTAEYRGNALIIDHMTPTLERSGTYGQLSNLSRYVQQYYGQEMSTQTKKGYQMIIVDEMVKANLTTDLELNASELYGYNETLFDVFVKNVLHEYLEEIASENIPYGMHILGEVPATNATSPYRDELSCMVRSMMKGYFEDNVTAAYYPIDDYPLGIPLNDTKVDWMVWEVVTNGTSIYEAEDLVYGHTNESVSIDLERGLEYKQRLIDSAIEMDRVINALSADFIPAGPGTDPVMNPNAVPTGRNFYGVNPELYPSEATWKLGVMLAQELLVDYYEDHGEYPTKISFSRFGVEFIRDHGTLEAEAMYLLGVKPVWDSNGYVVGVELIPEEELLPNYDASLPGRPRIDIVYATAGMRDAFPSKIKMLDDAVKLANIAPSGNYPNYVNTSTQAIYQDLYASLQGSFETEEETAAMAETLSTMRCFAVQDGTYDILVGDAIDASGVWESEDEIATLYLEKMGFVYGTELWGYQSQALLTSNLKNVEASVHSDSSNLYDTLDNDDFFQYFGGLNLATRYVREDHQTPDMYVSDTRDPNNAQMTGMKEYLSKNLRSRYFNPKWIDGMQGSGYAGGRMMAEFVDNLWGWEVTDPELVDDSVWDNVYRTYVNEDMKEWFNTENAGAYQSITGRMLEAVRKGYWEPSDEIVQSLTQEYMESVADNGATCCHHTCGNPLLHDFVQGVVSVPGVISDDVIQKYNEQLYKATLRTDNAEAVDTSSPENSRGGSPTGSAQVRPAGSSNQTMEVDGGVGTDLDKVPQESMRSTQDPNYVEGYEMTKETIAPPESSTPTFSGSDIVALILVAGAVVAVFIGFMRKRKI